MLNSVNFKVNLSESTAICLSILPLFSFIIGFSLFLDHIDHIGLRFLDGFDSLFMSYQYRPFFLQLINAQAGCEVQPNPYFIFIHIRIFLSLIGLQLL